MENLKGLRVAIIATNGFEESELTEPRKALEAAGAICQVISNQKEPIYGMKHHDKADTVDVDGLLEESSPKDYDAVLLPGGGLNADALRVLPRAQQFVTEINNAKKPIAMICHAPWLLVSAKLVSGRNMTSYHTIKDDLLNAGAKWDDREVVVNANWVSSRQPGDIPAFNREVNKLFASYLKQKNEQRAA